MAQSPRALVNDLLDASQQIQSSDVLQQLQKLLMTGEDSSESQQDQVDEKLVKMLLPVLPIVTSLLKRLHVERKELGQSNMQLLTKQTDHVQKVHHLEELQSEMQAKVMELQSVFTQQEAANKNLQREISGKVSELKHSEGERQKLQKELEECSVDCLTKEERLVVLQQELTSVKDDSSALKKDNARLVKENKKLRRNLDIVREQEEEVRNRFIVNKQATTKLKGQLQSREDTCRLLTARIEELQALESSLRAENMVGSSAGGRRIFSTVGVQTDDKTPMEWRVMSDLLRDVQDMSQDSALIAEQLRHCNSELRQRVGKHLLSSEHLTHQTTAASELREQSERLEAKAGQPMIQRLQREDVHRLGQRRNPTTALPLPQNGKLAQFQSYSHAQLSSMKPTNRMQGELAVPRRDIATWPTTTRHLGHRVDESALDDEGPVRFPPGNP